MVQMLTTKTSKETCCKCSQHNQIHFICSAFLFLVELWAFSACALSNWRKCFLSLQVFFSICSAFLFLVVLWAFAACVFSNWGSCFLNLQVFSEVAARWALSATVQKTILQFKPLKITFFFIELLPWHEEKSATDHANKTYNPSKCVCLLERLCMYII